MQGRRGRLRTLGPRDTGRSVGPPHSFNSPGSHPGVPGQALTPATKTSIDSDLSKIKFTAESAKLVSGDDGESRAFFYTNGLGEVIVKVPENGDHDIGITASCQATKGENAKFKLRVDGTPVGAETQLKSEDAKDYTFTFALKAGDRKIGREFTSDMNQENEYGLNFDLHGVKVVRK